MLDYGECSKAVPLDFEDEVRIIERQTALKERHWLERKGHLCNQNTRTSRASLHLRVFRFGFFQNGDVGVGVFPDVSAPDASGVLLFPVERIHLPCAVIPND